MDDRKLQYEFSADKNRQLIKERGVSFENVIAAMETGAVLEIISHPNYAKYPNQEIYVVNIIQFF